MIIRAAGADLLLIEQIHHAALAEQIIAAWQGDGLPGSPRRSLILLATRRHDDGWIDDDAAPLVDAGGGLLDYVHAPDDIRQGIWPRAVERLSDCPYAAALVAQHALHLFERYRTDAAWQDFFARMERARAGRLAAAAPLTEADLLRDYFFVRMADLLSLQFCDDWRQPQQHGDYESRWDGTRLTVTPDPFAGRSVPLQVQARRLPDVAYDAPAAAAAFRIAPTVTIEGTAGS